MSQRKELGAFAERFLPLPEGLRRKIGYFIGTDVGAVCSRFGKDSKEIKSECRRALWQNGLSYEEVFLYSLTGKDKTEKNAYLGEFSRYDFFRAANRKGDLSFFHRKSLVAARFSRFFGRETLFFRGKNDRDALLGFLKRHRTFFIKPDGASCGFGVEKRNIADFSSEEALFRNLLSLAPLLLEEEIVQAEETACFHSESLNTVRMQTVLSKDGSVSVLCPFLRIGRGASVTDNGGAGGLLVGVNTETGALFPFGTDETGRYYRSHPDTRLPFEGVILPRWQEALVLGRRLAKEIPTTHSVGWDLALSQSGWVMVEANARGQWIGQQLTAKRGIREEAYRALR